jgi:hypothetical protein
VFSLRFAMGTKLNSRPQGAPKPGVRGHEQRDASVGWIFGIVLFLLSSGVVIHLVLAALLARFKHSPTPLDAWLPLQHNPQPVASSFPRLQVSPRLDLSAFKAREDEQLTNYGWINRSAGIVRVPIERAMELVLQKGLPVRTNGQSGAGHSPAQLIFDRSSQRQPPKEAR